MTNRLTTIAILVALVLGGLGLMYPKSISQVIYTTTGTGAAGDVTGVTSRGSTATGRSGSVSVASTTLISLYNGDANTRVIDNVSYWLDGLTTVDTAVDSLQITAGTSTAAYTVDGLKVLENTVATSSSQLYVASTTPGVMSASPVVRLWPSATYLNFVLNATTSATSNIVVDTHSL